MWAWASPCLMTGSASLSNSRASAMYVRRRRRPRLHRRGARCRRWFPHEVARPLVQVAGNRAGSGTHDKRGAAPGAHARPLVEQRGVGDRPAVVQVPDASVVADDGVGEEHLVEHRVAGHLPQGPDFDAGLVHFEREPGDALVLGNRGVRAGEQHPEVGELSTRGPDLLAVDDPDIAVAHGARRQTCEVGTCAGLAEELAPGPLPGDCVGHVAVDLFARAVRRDRRRREPGPHAERRAERSELGDRLADPVRVAAAQAAAVTVDRQDRRGPTGETESLPPLGDGEIGIPVVCEPVAEFLDRVGRARCRLGARHPTAPSRVRTPLMPRSRATSS